MIDLPSVHDKTFTVMVLFGVYILNRLGVGNKRNPDSELLAVIDRASKRYGPR